MRNLFLICLLVLVSLQVRATDKDTVVAEKTVREKILMDIQSTLDLKNKSIDSTIVKLDGRVGKLDSVIKTTGNPRERIDKLVERVQILEEKQKAIEQNEINIYEANYQSAMINLVSMDREIKPLILFRTSKDFFDALNETSNPMNYDGFSKGCNCSYRKCFLWYTHSWCVFTTHVLRNGGVCQFYRSQEKRIEN
jgi:hypothetical protein